MCIFSPETTLIKLNLRLACRFLSAQNVNSKPIQSNLSLIFARFPSCSSLRRQKLLLFWEKKAIYRCFGISTILRRFMEAPWHFIYGFSTWISSAQKSLSPIWDKLQIMPAFSDNFRNNANHTLNIILRPGWLKSKLLDRTLIWFVSCYKGL